MKKKIVTAVGALIILTTAAQPPARGALCTIDALPAATLLLPYFEIDLNKFPRFGKVEQTIISLQNVNTAPVLAHVTLWTDLSVPTLSFDVYLTGYDVEEINLTELFYTGEIDGLSVSDTNTPGFVLGQTAAGGLQSLANLIKAHRGQSVNGRCYGRVPRGNRAIGYVTIDNVNQSSTLFPSDPGYFGPGGVAIDNNSLWGVALFRWKKSIQAEQLVHIEAGSFGAGDYTFYGRYVGYDGSDGREPLGRVWGARYYSGSQKTDFVVWRDSTVVQGPFSCNQLGNSGWYPLKQTQVVAFDESESAIELFFDPDTAMVTPGLPAEAQRVRVVSSDFDVGSFRSGWVYLNLNGEASGQSVVWVRQGLGKRLATHQGIPVYDDEQGGQPADASACGPAPMSSLSPIP